MEKKIVSFHERTYKISNIKRNIIFLMFFKRGNFCSENIRFKNFIEIFIFSLFDLKNLTNFEIAFFKPLFLNRY